MAMVLLALAQPALGADGGVRASQIVHEGPSHGGLKWTGKTVLPWIEVMAICQTQHIRPDAAFKCSLRNPQPSRQG